MPKRNPYNGLLNFLEADPSVYVSQHHPGAQEELYFRYYVKLKTGYQ